VLVAAACGGGGGKAKSPTTSAPGKSSTTRVPPTTAKPKPVLAPLTGLPDPTRGVLTRPALTVKIENLPLSHPQTGIDYADVVYEEVVECNITRLAAIFQSHVPPVAGPVRSVRNTDQALVRPLQGIFVYSGGAPISVQSIQTAPVKLFDESSAGNAMYRDPARVRPHNLYVRPPDIYAMAKDAVGPPPAMFKYGAPAGGTPATHALVRLGNDSTFDVTWDYDAVHRRWLRGYHGQPDKTVDGSQLSFANVIIHPVQYINRLGGACGDEGAQADLQAPATVTVLTRGRAIQAHWSQPDPNQPGTLTTASGAPLKLTPGPTWIELPKQGVTSDIS
jgi:hypothetical protein